jgi:PAS domain S-box-containing protein
LLAVAHSGRIKDADITLGLLQAIAPRVAAELERRQIESALRRSETRMRLLVEHSKDVMFYYQVSESAAFEYVSPAANDILGMPAEALLANPELAITVLDEDYRPLVLRALATGSEAPITARLRRPDGDTRWIEYASVAFRDGDGRLAGVGGRISDVTPRFRIQEELEATERHSRALLEKLPDSIVRLAATGVILELVTGEAFPEAGGAESVIGADVSDFLPAALAVPIRTLLQAVLRTGRHQRSEIEMATEGEPKLYEARCVPFGEDEALLILRDLAADYRHDGDGEVRRSREVIDSKFERPVRPNPYRLTFRELAILHLVADGSADKQIAESLGISIYTVNKHVGNILGKMNASSRTEAGVRAIREGLLA